MHDEVQSADGTKIGFFVEGQGMPIVIVHGGSQHASDWAKVAAGLVDRFRVVRIDRALYAKSRPIPQHAMQHEVDDLDAIIAHIGVPVVLAGHSSGAVTALEFARQRSSSLAGLILYEPPVTIDAPLGGDSLIRAEAAVARGDYGTAMQIHLTEFVQFSPLLVRIGRCIPFVWRDICLLAPEQIADVRGVESLDVGLDRYRAIDVATLLICGGRSPAHLLRRSEALRCALPRARLTTVPRWGHLANLRAPTRLAKIIGEFAQQCREVSASSDAELKQR